MKKFTRSIIIAFFLLSFSVSLGNAYSNNPSDKSYVRSHFIHFPTVFFDRENSQNHLFISHAKYEKNIPLILKNRNYKNLEIKIPKFNTVTRFRFDPSYKNLSQEDKWDGTFHALQPVKISRNIHLQENGLFQLSKKNVVAAFETVNKNDVFVFEKPIVLSLPAPFLEGETLEVWTKSKDDFKKTENTCFVENSVCKFTTQALNSLYLVKNNFIFCERQKRVKNGFFEKKRNCAITCDFGYKLNYNRTSCVVDPYAVIDYSQEKELRLNILDYEKNNRLSPYLIDYIKRIKKGIEQRKRFIEVRSKGVKQLKKEIRQSIFNHSDFDKKK